MLLKLDSQKPERIAFFSSLGAGIVTHIFALVNLLHNYDNILQQPRGYGAGITSGRWLLQILGDLNDAYLHLYFNLSVVNGLTFLFLIALSTALIVNFLRIEKPVSAVLAGCLMATFPTVCATMVFRYTAPYYGISLLLSVIAAWTIDRRKLGCLLSALCLACSMGIYQAYPPFTISLLVLVLMRDSLEDGAQLHVLIRRGVRYCFSLALGVILYFVILKLCMAHYSLNEQITLNTYQGIDTMGQISLAELPGLLKRAWISAAFFAVQDYCGLASVRPLKIFWLLLILVILVQTVSIMISRKTKPVLIAFCCLMGLLFPLAINFIVIMAPQSIIYTIMVYSFVLVGIAPLMLLEYMPELAKGKKWYSRIVGILLTGIVAYNAYYTNVNYTALYYANRQVENFANSLMIQVRMTDGYTADKKWIFVGEVDRFMLYDVWYETPYYGGVIGSDAPGLFNATYSRDKWFECYLGSVPRNTSQEEQTAMEADIRVAQMPCWPDNGCIRVIDDYVIVKLQEVAIQ